MSVLKIEWVLWLCCHCILTQAETQLILEDRYSSTREKCYLGVKGDIGALCSIQYATNLSEGASWNSFAVILLTNTYFRLADISHFNGCFYRVVEGACIPPPNPNSERLVFIAPGSYTMGSPPNEVNRQANEAPQTRVIISHGFWMYRYEVTQKEYGDLVDSYPSAFSGDLLRPVENVSWINATNFCGLMNRHENQAGRIPLGYEYRLPTEAEWEYACRAGSTNRFSWGDDPGFRESYAYMWYTGNSHIIGYPKGGSIYIGSEGYFPTHTVGTRKPNDWGLYDMNGNLWEWCLDWYGIYPGGVVIDPIGPSVGDKRVYRGGSMDSEAEYCRSATRSREDPDDWKNSLGFRPVLAPIIGVK